MGTPKTIWDRLAAEHLTDLRIRDIWYEGGGSFGIDEILHAVNCHDGLLDACKKARTCSLNSDVDALLRDVIAKAEAKQ